ncbi:hypothetical protein TEA_010411 [Camellia sinensis var. sinensis]|uniref:Lon N-terminal domain-containing protein n=1 Tax=Camellia sinensis var. sinensis TaxID=542762 RepID=A0A4S4DWQ5_CAMSN|nr:hypothetical protein TEA_010411 [Camellia sinensis var. sinensis]
MKKEASSILLSSEGLEDVDEFVGVSLSFACLASEVGSSVTFERFCHVSDLMQIGNLAFRENRFEEAINCYSRANTVKPGDPIILSNRCAAYLRICQFLKHRPPSASEHKPLTGLDPTIHAELALKDAEKVIKFRNGSVKSYILKANALILLEKYELARDVILLGLQIDPSSNPLKALERTTASMIGKRDHGKPERTDDFDCTLCLNVTLNNIIQKNFPEEYAERKDDNDSLTNFGGDLMPLFVMDVVLPCQKFHLNIFEPRYRLMVITDTSTGSIADFACEVEITECEPLPDGRFFLELESHRRFRILRNWDQDGYRVAEIEWVKDIYPSEGTRERTDLQEMTNNAAGFAQSWMRTARDAAQQRQDRSRLVELDKVESMMPTTGDPERYSFWLATLTNRRPSERLELLSLRDTNERIRRALVFMRAEEQGCRLQ